MSLTKMSTEDKGFDRILVPEGVHQAVIAHIIDWGTQEETWEGETKSRRLLRIGYAFPEQTETFEDKEGKQITRPLMISKWYTLSLSPKANLHKDISAILGRSLKEEEDITQLLGHALTVSVVHFTNKQNNVVDKIGSFMPLMKGVEPKLLSAEHLKVYDLDNPVKAVFDSLGEKEQEKIKSSPEFTPF